MRVPETFTIEVDGRRIELRRPTHGELDLGMLDRMVGVYLGYQKRLVDLEAAPEPGVAVRIASCVEIANDAAREVRERVRRVMIAIGGAGETTYVDADGDEVKATVRALEVATKIRGALVPPARLGK